MHVRGFYHAYTSFERRFFNVHRGGRSSQGLLYHKELKSTEYWRKKRKIMKKKGEAAHGRQERLQGPTYATGAFGGGDDDEKPGPNATSGVQRSARRAGKE